MHDVLKLAEKFEIEGYKFYYSKAKEIKSKVVETIFLNLAQMEKEHTEFIQRLMKEIEEGREITEFPTNAQQTFKSEYEKQKIDKTTQEDDLMDLAVLRLAYLIEKDFMEFYEKAAQNEKDVKVKSVLELLRNWEEGHKKIIEEQIKAIIEKNNLELGFYPF
ncbi:MAG: ferritin-like domain-containing protein [Fervidobacterium sp.]